MVGDVSTQAEVSGRADELPDPELTALSHILASVQKNGSPSLERFKRDDGAPIVEHVRQNDEGHHQIRFYPPDGGPAQDYIQVGHVHCETGFHGVMWQRCHADSTVYLEDNGPHTFVALPGSSHNALDNDTTAKAIAGEDISFRYDEGRVLGEEVVAYLNQNAAASQNDQLEQPSDRPIQAFGQGQITVISNSLGALAGPSVVASIQEQLGDDAVKQHMLLNGYLPTRALYETAEHFADEDRSAADIRERVSNVTTAIRPKDPTVVTRLSQEGDYDGHNGNDLYGRQYSVDVIVENGEAHIPLSKYTKEDIFAHAPESTVFAMYVNGQDAFTERTAEDDLKERFSPEESIDNTDEYNTKIGLFMGLKNLMSTLVEEIVEYVEGLASKFLDPQDFSRSNFYDAGDPSKVVTPPSNIPDGIQKEPDNSQTLNF